MHTCLQSVWENPHMPNQSSQIPSFGLWNRALLIVDLFLHNLLQGLTFFLTYSIFSAVLGMLQFGYNTGVINAPEKNIENFMKDVYKDRYGEDISEEFIQQLYSVAVSIFAIGGMLGGFSGGWMANRFGRFVANNFNHALSCN